MLFVTVVVRVVLPPIVVFKAKVTVVSLISPARFTEAIVPMLQHTSVRNFRQCITYRPSSSSVTEEPSCYPQDPKQAPNCPQLEQYPYVKQLAPLGPVQPEGQCRKIMLSNRAPGKLPVQRVPRVSHIPRIPRIPRIPHVPWIPHVPRVPVSIIERLPGVTKVSNITRVP